MSSTNDRCPKCGVLARYVVITARVHRILELDGSLGKVGRVREVPGTEEGRSYGCSAGHTWAIKPAIEHEETET